MKTAKLLKSLAEKCLGRTLAEDIVDKQSNNVIAKTGDIVSEEHLSLIDSAGLISIKVRSVLTCEAEFGVWQMLWKRFS